MGSIFGWILAGLGAIGGILWIKEYVRSRIRDRAFCFLFAIPQGNTWVIVCPTQPDADFGPNRPTTFEDSLAQAELQTELAKRGMRTAVRTHLETTENHKSGNMALICGPVGNLVTRELLSKQRLPFMFREKDSRHIIVDTSEQQLHPETVPGEVDFAILARIKNPWIAQSDTAFVFLAAGIHGLGTWGAAHLLAVRPDVVCRRLKADRFRGKDVEFAALIRVTRRGDYPPDTAIMDLQKV